jgi:hypothetical protein
MEREGEGMKSYDRINKEFRGNSRDITEFQQILAHSLGEIEMKAQKEPAKAGEIAEGILHKYEANNDCIFRKTCSLSVRASDLEKCDKVHIHLKHVGVVVGASKEEIKKHRDVKTFNEEVKYYYPVHLWKVVSGDEWMYRIWVKQQGGNYANL